MTNTIFFLLIFLLKFSIVLLFSSDYQLELFLPFLKNGIQNFPYDPWKLSFENGKIDAFPYHPLLLYLLIVFQLLPTLLNLPILLQKIFLVLPSLLADLLLFQLLHLLFPNRKKAILGVYFFSPIVLYAVYAHGQLDLLPTVFLFLSVYFLMQKSYIYSGISFGLALSMKLHVIAAIPLFLFFIYRKSNQKIISFILPLTLTFSLISLPWYLSLYFREMVLLNPKQDLLFESIYKIGDYKLLLPFFACFIVYLKFFSYQKINFDLFLTWLAILFSVFVLTIPPAPGWYIWTLPFLTYFYLKFVRKKKHIIYLGGIFYLSYLLFFLFSWKGDHISLRFLSQEISLQFTNDKLNGLLFTGLCTSLLANLYAVYQLGVRSNRIYYKPSGILIGIGGDSGAGKSTLLHSIARLLEPSVTLLEGDGDHRWERGHENYQKFTHLNPRANYLERQAENLYLLKKGEIIYRPDYDHSTGKFTEPKPVYPSDYIIISGLHTFYLPKMRKVIDIKLFVDTEEKLRKHWKILRDIKKRGYTKEKILRQIEEREIDSSRYIQPQKSFADMSIEYFSISEFEIGEETTEIQLGLKLTFLSEFSLESLAIYLEEKNYLVDWNYLEDLQRQYFIFDSPIPKESLDDFVEIFVPNKEELVYNEISWDEGYLGIVQFFTLLLIHQKLKNLNELYK